MLLGYSDLELVNKGGYDLVHYDDLAYVASAHQERKYNDHNLTITSWRSCVVSGCGGTQVLGYNYSLNLSSVFFLLVFIYWLLF